MGASSVFHPYLIGGSCIQYLIGTSSVCHWRLIGFSSVAEISASHRYLIGISAASHHRPTGMPRMPLISYECAVPAYWFNHGLMPWGVLARIIQKHEKRKLFPKCAKTWGNAGVCEINAQLKTKMGQRRQREMQREMHKKVDNVKCNVTCNVKTKSLIK